MADSTLAKEDTTFTPRPTKELAPFYRRVRNDSAEICGTLQTEDFVIQSMPDVSPTRWHLAHTTWFFETFVLKEALPQYRPDPDFAYLFNSYYNSVGDQFPRPRRGLLSRPTVKEVFEYRRRVDEHIGKLFNDGGAALTPKLSAVIELGLHHERQHQELMLTDIKHVFSFNPLYPVYRERDVALEKRLPPLHWPAFEEGLYEIGHDSTYFSYDNETPRHSVFQQAFEIADRLVTNGEFLQFIEDGGYRTPQLWLSDGWTTVQSQRRNAPLYWIQRDGAWHYFTLSGLRRVNPAEPVCHVSYFEADAYARWAGASLPTEAMWEIAAQDAAVEGNFFETRNHHPIPLATPSAADIPAQMFGDAWEWTSSPYVSYPGFSPTEGALGEYNAKFMCNQMVLRGGSCATAQDHIRSTYRNFFPPSARWQFSGIRLAR